MTGLAARSLALAFRGLAATWRFEIRGAEHLDGLAGRPFVFVLWHHALLPLLWWHRSRGITLLVSGHRDGELVAQAAAGLGYRLARGSSTRGGSAGYRGVLRALAAGSVVALTPDGPVGPPHVLKPGVVRAARRAGVPVLPVSARAARPWRLRSWDRLIVPRPASRIVVEYGAPLTPGVNLTADCAAVAHALDALVPPARPEAA